MNTKLLHQALEFIKAHPECWNQDRYFTDPINEDVPKKHDLWECGTQMCLAGVVVYLDNKTEVVKIDDSHIHMVSPKIYSSVGAVAAESLDLPYSRYEKGSPLKLFFDYPEDWKNMGPERFAEWVWNTVN